MSYSEKPTYSGQKRELKPEGKELLAKTKKLLARVVLPLIITATAFGASQTESGKTFLGIANEVKSGEVIPEGETMPDLITVENGGKSDIQFDLGDFTQDEYTLNDNEVIHIKKNASLRGAPFVGSLEDDTATTVATTNEDIIISGKCKYSIISHPENAYKDQFIIIDLSSFPQKLRDELGINPDLKVLFIKLDIAHSEVLIENIAEVSNAETVASVSEQ